MFGKTFGLLQQEAYLTRTALITGFRALRKANVSDVDKGEFYSASFQLSIGFERFMKIILVAHHMAQNDLTPMTDKELKKYSHDLKSLFELCKQVAVSYGLDTSQYLQDGEISHDILCLLSNFAKASRYYNLDGLSAAPAFTDPLQAWWDVLQSIIWSDEVRESKRQKIQQATLAYCDAMGNNGFTMLTGLNGQLMTLYDAIAIPQLINAASPILAWHTFKIISPLYRLLDKIVDEVHKVEIAKGMDFPHIPYLCEFFPFLLLDKKAVMQRKSLGLA